ncbi:hypothetical protein CYL18_14460 [Pradoshia eiseniae]|uniref:Uncharacterized protein n=1 Tax=Pradoshia eiseniae TaxID=2064768 RepID=A0A2S7MX90_9BACI|nr:DUF5412 family protein [Pradoshia eiseniae]PQD94414.1 hypothetical protein CYL18_14460 [Pradoshia eiseniae]
MPILVLTGLVIAIVLVPLFFILVVNLLKFVIHKKPFPKRLFVATLTGMIFVSSIYIYQTYFFTFDRIDRESMQKGPGPIASPTGRYTADAFYELYGGAAGGVNVWVEVTDHNNQDRTKTIYYSNANSHIGMEWKDEDVLFIQNEDSSNTKSMELNVKEAIYHGTGLACRSLVMIDEYETCYSD